MAKNKNFKGPQREINVSTKVNADKMKSKINKGDRIAQGGRSLA